MGAEAREGQYHYRTYALGEQRVAPVLQRVYTNLAAIPGKPWVLDLGSGPGRLAMNAPRPRGFRFLGIDQSPVAIDQFKEAIAQDGRMDDAMVGDITSLSLPPDRSYGAAISWRVLHALEPKDQVKVAGEVYKILPEGGSFYVAVASEKDWKAGELAARGEFRPRALNECQQIMRLDGSFKVDFYTQQRVEELAQRAGFRIAEIEEFMEATGYEHLRAEHPDNAYIYAQLVKK